MTPRTSRRWCAVILALAVFPSVAHAGPGNPFTDVSDRPIVQQDFTAAIAYWHATQPSLTTSCGTFRVIVGPMVAAVGNNGEVIPASQVWAETELNGCEINLAPQMWATRHSFPRLFCDAIVHEVGHIFGLPDSRSVAMMDATVQRDRSPACAP